MMYSSIQLLARIDTVTCTQVLSLLKDSTKKQGSMSRQEERDVLFARLFGLMAVIRSGLLVRQTPLSASSSSSSSSTPVSTLKNYEEVLQILLDIGEAKVWLRESAWWVMVLALDAVQSSSVPWKKDAFDATISLLFLKEREKEKGKAAFWTPEKVAMTLKLQSLMPDHDWDDLLAPMFKGRNLFTPTNLVSLGRILKVHFSFFFLRLFLRHAHSVFRNA